MRREVPTGSAYPLRRVPPRALVMSVGALSVPVAAALFFPETLGEYGAMLWLLALVPAFLLAYYHGWRGVSVALGVGMAVLSVTQGLGILLRVSAQNWPLLALVVIAYLGITLGIGWLSDALRRLEANYRELVEHAPYGICRCSPQGRFLQVNPALVEMLGYDSEAELRAVDLNTGIDATPDGWAALARQLQESGRVVGTDVVWKRMDGTRIKVRLSGRELRNEEGQLKGFELIAEDVTERLALDGQLRQAQKMEDLGRLTGGIAHDLNNILTVIQTDADLLARDLPAGATDQQAEVQELLGAAHRGASLIRKLMAFSRQEVLSPKPLNLAAQLTGLMEMLRRLLPEHISIRVFGSEEVGTVLADPGAVEQMILNLATNARDAMPDGGLLLLEVRRASLDEEFRLTYGFGQPGEYVCLSVSDTGIGMDERTKEKIFDPFYTTKPPGAGTGLGMSMVYGLMKQHNGSVQIYSEVGHGTTVRLYFPVTAEQAASSVVRQPTREIRGGSETILVVEDEDALRRVSQRVLERYGYTVLLAANGEEAIEGFRTHASDIALVFSDLIMPKMGGRRLYDTLQPRSDGPKYLFTSGYTARDIGERCSLDPRLPFLPKPWTVTELLTTVREVLDSTEVG